MKRLLLSLLAALALPDAVNAEEFTELKPINPHSYMKSSLKRWEKEGKKYMTFKGTSIVLDCYGDRGQFGACPSPFGNNPDNIYAKRKATEVINKYGWKTVLFEYSIDFDEKTYNREGDVMGWTGLLIDQTPYLVAQKYCPIEEWSKLPNK